jgi:hypothetical protein
LVGTLLHAIFEVETAGAQIRLIVQRVSEQWAIKSKYVATILISLTPKSTAATLRVDFGIPKSNDLSG